MTKADRVFVKVSYYSFIVRRGDAIIPQLSLSVKGFFNIFVILYNLSLKRGFEGAGIGRITKKWTVSSLLAFFAGDGWLQNASNLGLSESDWGELLERSSPQSPFKNFLKGII